ncbi:hypothetical protein [Paraglaciecola aestuariivivens]
MLNKLASMGLLVCSLIFLFYSNAVKAKTLYGECYGCSENASIGVAVGLAREHADESPLFTVHIANIKHMLVYSFKVVDRDGEITINSISTPSDIESKMKDVVEAYSLLRERATSTQIPKTIMSSAWEYVNCLYCKNNITDYLASTLHGQILRAGQTVNTIAELFGLVKTNVPNQFNIPLEAGGKVIIKLEVDAQANLYIEVVDVVDSDNNSIPFEASKLHNARIVVSSYANAQAINSFINRFNFYVPKGMTGKVTITDNP